MRFLILLSLLLLLPGLDAQAQSPLRETQVSKPKVVRTNYDMEELGFNYRLTDFQAALGISQLKRLNQFITRRRQIVDYYNSFFKDNEFIKIPVESEGANSNFHLYVITVRKNKFFDRYDLFNYLQNNNFRPMIHYIPIHYLS